MEIYEKKEKQYGPRRVDLVRTIINALGIFAAGFLGSLIVMAFLFMLSSAFGFNFEGGAGTPGFKEGFLFPFLLSLIVFLATTITMLFTYYVLTVTHSNNYKKNISTFFHIILSSILVYIVIIPIYLNIGSTHYENILMVFLFHVIITSLLFSIILELLNNYTHLILGIYSSFLGTIITIFFIILLGLPDNSKGKFYIIIFLVPVINGLIYLSKQFIEFIYYSYFNFTGNDPIGNVFYQIEKEEQEE
ncbi:MAG: hypothetical protein WC850_04900 [Candidatus Gracilibacteria bacterium]